ncbi:MAG: PLP-dependent transferase, partial [Gammaproteobacteria bacterium]|nr:PLP-dependent transferase [Gammaproteobacteria bacterium]
IRHKQIVLGGALDPHAAFLLQRGLKTLALRVRYQNESTLRIARFLEGHRSVRRVHYPGLERHPQHARARELFAGCGGVLSFELDGDAARADEFAARVRIPAVAPSLGGVHSLLTRPATTSHAGLSAADRERLGIRDALLRFSVGIETTEDLLEDLEQALR